MNVFGEVELGQCRAFTAESEMPDSANEPLPKSSVGQFESKPAALSSFLTRRVNGTVSGTVNRELAVRERSMGARFAQSKPAFTALLPLVRMLVSTQSTSFCLFLRDPTSRTSDQHNPQLCAANLSVAQKICCTKIALTL